MRVKPFHKLRVPVSGRNVQESLLRIFRGRLHKRVTTGLHFSTGSVYTVFPHSRLDFVLLARSGCREDCAAFGLRLLLQSSGFSFSFRALSFCLCLLCLHLGFLAFFSLRAL